VLDRVTGEPTGRLQRRSANAALRSISKFAKMAAKVDEELLVHCQKGSVPYKPDVSSDEEVAKDLASQSCRICKLYVGEHDLVQAHVRERHPEKVTCTLCSEMQPSEGALWRHMILHENGTIEKRMSRVPRLKVTVAVCVHTKEATFIQTN